MKFFTTVAAGQHDIVHYPISFLAGMCTHYCRVRLFSAVFAHNITWFIKRVRHCCPIFCFTLSCLPHICADPSFKSHFISSRYLNSDLFFGLASQLLLPFLTSHMAVSFLMAWPNEFRHFLQLVFDGSNSYDHPDCLICDAVGMFYLKCTSAFLFSSHVSSFLFTCQHSETYIAVGRITVQLTFDFSLQGVFVSHRTRENFAILITLRQLAL